MRQAWTLASLAVVFCSWTQAGTAGDNALRNIVNVKIAAEGRPELALPGQATKPGGRGESDDVDVYDAVLRHTIRNQNERFSSGAGLKTPAPLIVVDQTVAFCQPQVGRGLECLHPDWIAGFEAGSTRARVLPFEGRLNSVGRQELARSFRDRNSQRRPFPAGRFDDLVPVAPDQVQNARARESKRTVGHTVFSTPGYSSDGHALVYATYTCGGLCGYGWLFLLERQNETWRVIDRHMIWIS